MSNENREQQMMAAAEAYVEESEEIYNIVGAITDFCAGWRAADKHPQWIPVEERLPEPNIYKEGKTFPLVLVCLNDGCVDTDAYDTDTKTWCKYDGEVAYWMSLPQPPRKEAKND